MKAFLQLKLMILVLGLLINIFLLSSPGFCQCLCRGDVVGPNFGPPDGIVDLNDLNLLLFHLSQAGPPYIIPATGIECGDLTDINGQGADPGDGLVSLGDINFMVCELIKYMPNIIAPCFPVPCSCPPLNPEIQITINGHPWDGSSSIQPRDVVGVKWVEHSGGPGGWIGGFSNFNLHVSRGLYFGDFATTIDWQLQSFNITDDGQGGFNFDGGATTGMWPYPAGVVFTFSFEIPDEIGPAYNITIAPTQGGWGCDYYDQLPSVVLPVAEKSFYVCHGISANDPNVCSGHGQCVDLDTCQCATAWTGSMCEQCYYLLQGDWNNDCIVNVVDFAEFVSVWLVNCADDPGHSACVSPD